LKVIKAIIIITRYECSFSLCQLLLPMGGCED